MKGVPSWHKCAQDGVATRWWYDTCASEQHPSQALTAHTSTATANNTLSNTPGGKYKRIPSIRAVPYGGCNQLTRCTQVCGGTRGQLKQPQLKALTSPVPTTTAARPGQCLADQHEYLPPPTHTHQAVPHEGCHQLSRTPQQRLSRLAN